MEIIENRYEIETEIGRGGMATVYRALDRRVRRYVAVKVLPRPFTHDPRFIEQFTKEAEIVVKLEHAAIVPVYDYGEHEDAPFLIMRYMSGGTLRDRLHGEPWPLDEIILILDRIAPAIDKAHASGIIHRDIKPSNLLYDDDGNVYLADFGLARLADAQKSLSMLGTPAYVSPEQVTGDLIADGRADIYALGVILYELLTGFEPYIGQTPSQKTHAHVFEPVPNILDHNPDLPPESQQVIDKVLAKDREERYSTAAELAAAVRSLAKIQTSVTAEPETKEPSTEAIQTKAALLDEEMELSVEESLDRKDVEEVAEIAEVIERDDLKAIWGIGNKTEEKLNEAGIYTYETLAATSPQELAHIGSASVKTAESWIARAKGDVPLGQPPEKPSAKPEEPPPDEPVVAEKAELKAFPSAEELAEQISKVELEPLAPPSSEPVVETEEVKPPDKPAVEEETKPEDKPSTKPTVDQTPESFALPAIDEMQKILGQISDEQLEPQSSEPAVDETVKPEERPPGKSVLSDEYRRPAEPWWEELMDPEQPSRATRVQPSNDSAVDEAAKVEESSPLSRTGLESFMLPAEPLRDTTAYTPSGKTQKEESEGGMGIILGCLFVLATRIGAIAWWVMDPARWHDAFVDWPLWWLWPGLGVIYLPVTTVAYVFAYPGGIVGFDWVLIVSGLVVDAVSAAALFYSART